MSARLTGSQPRPAPALHPLSWWVWAVGSAVVVTRVGNPVVIGLLLIAVVAVAVTCRQPSLWARTLEGALILGVFVIAVRTGFYILVGLPDSTPVILDLPTIDLPRWFTNITLLGPLHFGGLIQALIEGLRLATLIIIFGALNALANPRRALRYLPSSLHHLGTAAIIAVSAAPQLITAVSRVRRAQTLRGGSALPASAPGSASNELLEVHRRKPRSHGRRRRRLRGLLAVLIPVLAGALDQALSLAASMDSRGYARAAREGGKIVGVALILALFAAAAGTYGLLDAGTPNLVSVGLLLGGLLIAIAASMVASSAVLRTRYRPEPWGWRETAVAACGLAAASTALIAVTAPLGLGAWQSSAPGLTLPWVGALLVALTVAPIAVPPASATAPGTPDVTQAADPAQLQPPTPRPQAQVPTGASPKGLPSD